MLQLPVTEWALRAGMKPNGPIFVCLWNMAADAILQWAQGENDVLRDVRCKAPFRRGSLEILGLARPTVVAWNESENTLDLEIFELFDGTLSRSAAGRISYDADGCLRRSSPETAIQGLWGFPGQGMIALLYTFALCHVRNAQVRDEVLSRSTRRRLQRDGVDFDDVRIKTLWTIPFSTSDKRQRRRGASATPTRFTLVKGHFATYTSARPLFGKHVGTFWIADHDRGSKEFGTTENRYAVVATDEDAAALKAACVQRA